MKNSLLAVASIVAFTVMLCGGVASAVTIQTVVIGNANNVGEGCGDSYGGYGADRICGSVNYTYAIGKYEVTAGQYTEFLNAKATTGDTYGLYNPLMADSDNYGCMIQRTGDGVSVPYSYSVTSGYTNRPVNYVSFLDAARFTNWLQNGQGTSNTETGAYTLNGTNGVVRNANTQWFLPSEDEWYKAAYYKGGAYNAGYWNYPTQSDSAPAGNMSNFSLSNNANYSPDSENAHYYTTAAGTFTNSASTYGTFDQGGNLREWTEMSGDEMQGTCGGAFSEDAGQMAANSRSSYCPADECDSLVGFRVAAAVVQPWSTWDGTGNWNDYSHWSDGAPSGANSGARVRSGTTTIDGTVTANTNAVLVGWAGNGNINMTGGSLSVTGTGGDQVLSVGDQNTGTFTQSGGVVTTNYLVLGRENVGSAGSYNLNGGTLNAGAISVGSGAGTLTLNGGTLKPTASTTNWIGATVKLNVGPVGGIIDSPGLNVTINASIAGPGPLTLRGDNGTITLAGINTYTGTTTVTTGATLRLAVAAQANALRAGACTDLQAGALLVFEYDGTTSPAAAVLAALHESYVAPGGKFAAGPLCTTMGYAAGYGLGWKDTGMTVQVRIAQYGDADLNGTVDFHDLSVILGHYNQGGVWATGDCTYDGLVNFDDLSLCLGRYNQSLPAGFSVSGVNLDVEAIGMLTDSGFVVTVPEPGTIALLLPVLGLFGYAGARRRRK